MRLKIISTAILLQCYMVLHAQEMESSHARPISTNFLLKTAVNSASGNQIREVYGPGFSIGMGLVFKALSNKLWLTPYADVTYFGNKYDASLRDDLFMKNLGGTVEWNFQIGKTDNTSIAPAFGVFYVLGENNFRPRKNYTGEEVHVYSFEGVAFRPGISFIHNHVKLSAAYQLCNIKGKLDEELKKSIELAAWDAFTPPIYEMYLFPDRKFDLSYFQLSIGFLF